MISAITQLEEETFTEYIALRFQAFAEKLLVRQLIGDLLIETVRVCALDRLLLTNWKSVVMSSDGGA